MASQLTISSLRALYQSLASTPAAFVSETNEVSNRLMNEEGIWSGCTEEVLFSTSDRNYIVLPRQFTAVLGYDREDVPMPIFGQFHQYIEMGIGWQDPTQMVMAGLLDAGFTVTQLETSGTFTLRVKLTNSLDASKLIRFSGLDADGKPVITTANGAEGVNLTTAYPSADTTQQFTAVTGIQAAPNLLGRWTLWQVVGGVETQVGSYEPGETVPLYRKYTVGVRYTPDVIRCFCSRRWIPAVFETDFVHPDCVSAFKMGYKALQLENANKNDGPQGADAQWARAFKELDDTLARMRGGELPSLQIISGPYPRIPVIVN